MFELSKQGIVDVIGGEAPLCANALDDLNALFDQCLSLGPPRLVLDMSAMPFIDSAGLEWLLDARDRCAESGGVMHLVSPNQLGREILQITGVRTEFEAFDDVLQAVGSFAR